ncbi:MAG: hypothetical protein PHO56_05285 [Patescibacteria group bacterium]|nr:hypothetical protein [Patescibacteria group bacterium]
MFTKKIILITSIIIGILLIFIAGLLLWNNYYKKVIIENPPATTTGEAPAASVEAGKKATESLINEIKNSAGNANSGSPAQVVTVDHVIDGKTVADQAVSVAPGARPISVTNGEVVANNGGAAQNSATQGSASSPTQSVAVDPAKLPQGSIKLAINQDNSIAPNSFTVHPGQAVALAVTNNTPWSEIIIFDDPALAALGFSLLPKSTRAMTFNAPSKTGEYIFASDIPSQRANGMQGKMIVK